MKLAAQLFKASAARSRGRLALLTWAVAFGVLILFLFSAYHHALFDRSYTVWRQGYDQARSAFWYDQELAPGDGDPLWMQLRLDSAYALGDHATSVMQVATDTGSPELPAGLPRWPEPGGVLGFARCLGYHGDQRLRCRDALWYHEARGSSRVDGGRA